MRGPVAHQGAIQHRQGGACFFLRHQVWHVDPISAATKTKSSDHLYHRQGHQGHHHHQFERKFSLSRSSLSSPSAKSCHQGRKFCYQGQVIHHQPHAAPSPRCPTSSRRSRRQLARRRKSRRQARSLSKNSQSLQKSSLPSHLRSSAVQHSIRRVCLGLKKKTSAAQNSTKNLPQGGQSLSRSIRQHPHCTIGCQLGAPTGSRDLVTHTESIDCRSN